MFTVKDLLEKKSKFEKERMFLDAKISVVDEMIAEAKEKEKEQIVETVVCENNDTAIV